VDRAYAHARRLLALLADYGNVDTVGLPFDYLDSRFGWVTFTHVR